jgi:hypothetical protein
MEADSRLESLLECFQLQAQELELWIPDLACHLLPLERGRDFTPLIPAADLLPDGRRREDIAAFNICHHCDYSVVQLKSAVTNHEHAYFIL